MTKPSRKKPTTFVELEADIEEAEKLGLKSVDELYDPKIIAIGVGDFLSNCSTVIDSSLFLPKYSNPRTFEVDVTVKSQTLLVQLAI